MIKVLTKKEKNQFQKITFTGHAMYDDYGKDIVCSGVSSIVITTVNGLYLLDKEYISVEEKKDGLIITVLKHDETCEKLLENMMNLLSELEKDYPKHVQIK